MGKLEEDYVVLNISKGASLKEVKRAFFTLINKWHPDKNIDNPEKKEAICNTKFRQIRDAYYNIRSHIEEEGQYLDIANRKDDTDVKHEMLALNDVSVHVTPIFEHVSSAPIASTSSLTADSSIILKRQSPWRNAPQKPIFVRVIFMKALYKMMMISFLTD